MAIEKLSARRRMQERIEERLEDFSSARQRMRERIEDLSIAKLVPSVLTLLGLCCGATAIRFALSADWNWSVAAIVAAMVFDMLDGRAARMFGADTRFGAQLDSLVDLVSFGVAPAVIVYLWSLERMGIAGWVSALLFCACSAIRLARFNIQSVAARDEGATKANPYFTGLPMPAAAFLCVLPMMLSFQLGDGLVRTSGFTSAIIVLAAALMVSRLPTPSIKYMHLPRNLRVAAFAAFCIFVALLINWPWPTLTGGFVLYAASIPVTLLRHVRNRSDDEPAETD
ncbi:MAG: CDP-diacylglycerol--serine O-phosphatidyltransferase [Alphaproteobacteria bacterium]|nr:CDP-diacylglycerol--serine O-phosphatidyltransferase [Alphaproteobacteria bacterium]MBV9693454.1 CDP-diacylglycerol--serine O-phosphatidyltransferase [Alphaproteobacteria bacterium]